MILRTHHGADAPRSPENSGTAELERMAAALRRLGERRGLSPLFEDRRDKPGGSPKRCSTRLQNALTPRRSGVETGSLRLEEIPIVHTLRPEAGSGPCACYSSREKYR